MKTSKTLLLLYFLVLLLAACTTEEQKTTLENESNSAFEIPRTDVFTIYNSETRAQNEIVIKLPEGYEENQDKSYPVIYYTDPAVHTEIISAATDMLMKNAFLVGVGWPKDMSFGKEASFLKFFLNDVFPTLESKYRIDADDRTFFSYSAGAMFGAFMLGTTPNSFKNYLLGSPAFINSAEVKQQVFDLLSDTSKKNFKANVFVTYGTLEEEAGKPIEEFVTLLSDRNDDALILKKAIVPGDHMTAFPMTGLMSIQWLIEVNNQ